MLSLKKLIPYRGMDMFYNKNWATIMSVLKHCGNTEPIVPATGREGFTVVLTFKQSLEECKFLVKNREKSILGGRVKWKTYSQLHMLSRRPNPVQSFNPTEQISYLYHIFLKKHVYNSSKKKYQATIASLTRNLFFLKTFLKESSEKEIRGCFQWHLGRT